MDTQLARFLAGELDTLGLRGEDYAVFSQEKMDALDATIYDVGPAFSTTFLVFNQNPDFETEDGTKVPGTVKPEVLYWTTNKEFRLAMAYLIDRQTIINNVAFGFGYPQYSFIPRVSPYYWEGADAAAAKYDPWMAVEILDGLGWVDTDGDGWREDDLGNKIVFELTTNSGNTVREAVGTLFAEEAAAVGVQVRFKPEDFNTMVGKLLSGQNWDGILIGLTGSVDPISGSNVYPSNGNLHMINPNQKSPLEYWEYEVDEAWKVANNTTDEEKRKLGFEIVQRLWIEENPWIFTFNASVMAAYSNKFGNIYHRPLDGFDWKGIMDHMYVKTTINSTAIARRGTIQEMKVAIDSGIDVNKKDTKGMTLLMIAAASNQNIKMISLLLDAGADGSFKSNEGKTAFDYAKGNKYLKGTKEYWKLNDARFK